MKECNIIKQIGEHMMALIPPNIKVQSMPKKRMLVMKQINIYAWQVLIL